MQTNIVAAERLIVAADFDPREYGGLPGALKKLDRLIQELEGLGVYIKVNSLLRAQGYQLIERLHAAGLRVFADLKLIDIPATMEFDAAFLKAFRPEIVTVMCSAGLDGMRRVHELLPETTVLGVTALTSLDDKMCHAIFGCRPDEVVRRSIPLAFSAGIEGLVLSPRENQIVRNHLMGSLLELVNPGVRLFDQTVLHDDQIRVLTPYASIKNGARRIIVGRPIVQAPDPRSQTLRIIDEIQKALDKQSLD